eukprot:SAG22_NODE_1291_length_4852_cov_3.176310_2_plen_589_part_00
MGAAESVVRNVDKRTSRREHRDVFIGAIQSYRQQGGKPFEHARAPSPDAAAGPQLQGRCISVCVRKRPMFEHEWKEELEFDVITTDASRVAIHDARMQADMRKMFMSHHEFGYDAVFGDQATNDAVYAGTASPLVRDAASGGHACVMMYGQTGSGKTYTMSAIYERAAAELFATVGAEAVARGAVVVSCTFVELAGDVCCDMLNGGKVVNLATGQNGEVLPIPCAEVICETAADLVAMIRHATSLRATHATGVHDASSRSHAVCRMYTEYPGSGAEGCLTLVDLAGSEHKIDSMWHGADRRKEGAQINASLMALKDCIRERVQQIDKSFSYRKAKLTMLLKPQLSDPTARVVVIATVSPSSKDTEHSLNTLRHACVMDGQQDAAARKAAAETGRVSQGIGSTRTVQLGGEATVLSFKGSDHCLSFCFSAFPCGSTALTSDRCNQRSTWPASPGGRATPAAGGRWTGRRPTGGAAGRQAGTGPWLPRAAGGGAQGRQWQRRRRRGWARAGEVVGGAGRVAVRRREGREAEGREGRAGGAAQGGAAGDAAAAAGPGRGADRRTAGGGCGRFRRAEAAAAAGSALHGAPDL